MSTRASDASWAANDTIGISSTLYTNEDSVAGPYINVPYTTEKGDGNFTGKTPLFFYKPMTLTAYYPFTGEEDKAPGIITAKTGVENQSKENQPKIDFLWDSKTGVNKQDFSVGNPNVNFIFAYKMSKITFTFQGSEPVYDEEDPSVMLWDGVDVRTMVSYNIEGLGIEGTFNTATGVCAINDKRAGLTIDFEKETKEVEDKYKYKREFPSLIVFPQSKPDDKNIILHITTDELKEGQPKQHYKCALIFTDDEIKSGYHYNFTIQVTRRGLIVGNLKIDQWVAENKFIVATIDGNEDNTNKIEEK